MISPVNYFHDTMHEKFFFNYFFNLRHFSFYLCRNSSELSPMIRVTRSSSGLLFFEFSRESLYVIWFPIGRLSRFFLGDCKFQFTFRHSGTLTLTVVVRDYAKRRHRPVCWPTKFAYERVTSRSHCDDWLFSNDAIDNVTVYFRSSFRKHKGKHQRADTQTAFPISHAFPLNRQHHEDLTVPSANIIYRCRQ